jgi:hypothetical protein
MGGRSRSGSSGFNGWNRTLFSPDRDKWADFRRANPTAPPPAKGRRYDDYVAEWNKNNPPKSIAAAVVPTAAVAAEAAKKPTDPEANLTGAVQLAPSGQLGQTEIGASKVANTLVSNAPTPEAQQAPNLTGAVPNPAMTGGAQTTPQSQLTVGQLSPTAPTAGAQTQTGGMVAKPSASGAGDSAAQYNQTAITPQTGPSTGAAGINPAAAAAAARRSNQNVSSASQYLMPSISGLRFGGY